MAVTVYNRMHNSSGAHSHPQLSRSLERILEEAHLSGELSLSNRKLKEFPKTATKYNLADTVIADLSRNRFCELPEDVTTFAFLETLILYHNPIRNISPSVKSLTSLTYLDLRSNQLSTLPRELCFLPLHVLLVSNNRLVQLPDELGRMEKLTDLDASYNQLSNLPTRIGDLRSLRSLSLRNNQLMYLPRELTYLSLISLDVSNNRIAGLPLEMRQMQTLVEFNLENNPLTSPPASLCIRGLVHVFKYLETQASKDEKGKSGGNYDGYTTLRRTARHSANNTLEQPKSSRHPVDFGYNTCDGIDKRWSHDVPNNKPKNTDSPQLSQKPTDNFHLDLSTVQLKIEEKNGQSDGEFKQSQVQSQKEDHLIYANSSSSSSPEEDVLTDNQSREDRNKNFGNIQTYREYKEALKQQRNQDVYKLKGQKNIFDTDSNIINSNSNSDDLDSRSNGSGGSIKNGCSPPSDDGMIVIPKKPIQKVIPSRNTESSMIPKPVTDEKKSYTNGDCSGYVKPSSPMKTANGILSNNNANSMAGSKIPGGNKIGSSLKTANATNKANRTVTWNHDIPAEKLSFTMRREFDKHKEETELIAQLRNIIETRLKMTLPEDIASALTDGVVLCHLANYVRPRSVASIHVPSPGVSKLTMARCRRNVDNFLEACRKIGVDEELICSCADVVPGGEVTDDDDIALPNPSAVYATIFALLNTGNKLQHKHATQQHSMEQLTPATNAQTTKEWENEEDELKCFENSRQNQHQQVHGDHNGAMEFQFHLNNNHMEVGNCKGNLRFNNKSRVCRDDDELCYVNERIRDETMAVLQVNNLNLPNGNDCTKSGGTYSKFKLLEMPNNVNVNKDTNNPEKIVTKRIEFFEDHRSANNCKNKNSIFSIYETNSTASDGKKFNEKDLNSFKHDSSTLTIILSCIFIVTFLLLVFFPIPS